MLYSSSLNDGFVAVRNTTTCIRRKSVVISIGSLSMEKNQQKKHDTKIQNYRYADFTKLSMFTAKDKICIRTKYDIKQDNTVYICNTNTQNAYVTHKRSIPVICVLYEIVTQALVSRSLQPERAVIF